MTRRRRLEPAVMNRMKKNPFLLTQVTDPKESGLEMWWEVAAERH